MRVIGLSAFVGAIAVGDLVKTTLGPKGMDKILQSAWVYRPSNRQKAWKCSSPFPSGLLMRDM